MARFGARLITFSSASSACFLKVLVICHAKEVTEPRELIDGYDGGAVRPQAFMQLTSSLKDSGSPWVIHTGHRSFLATILSEPTGAEAMD